MAEDQMNSKVAVVGLSDSDITPHVYEGGFKTWECSVDLANYISTCMYRDQGTKGQEEQHFVEVCYLRSCSIGLLGTVTLPQSPWRLMSHLLGQFAGAVTLIMRQ